MHRNHVTLVGFHDQGNLGLGYLGATLKRHGFDVVLLDFRAGDAAILDAIRAHDPVLVGFSLIFQYYLADFRSLVEFLRREGVAAHFCIGGHFPTLRYEQMLAMVPEIDTVVRCEGEWTLLSLVRKLSAGAGWKNIRGIAFRDGDRVVASAPRPLIEDLDQMPYPLRAHESLTVLGQGVSPILAGRGCARNCSFCSIRQFYREAPGRKIRLRSPQDVVAEMLDLHIGRGTSIFLFQDDDFPLHGKAGRRWITQFVDGLASAGLTEKVIWKISCRADEVDRGLFAAMRQAGLYMVYLGLESGNASGLAVLNKQLTVADNLRAVRVLKALDLSMAYGFMLFDPSTCFAGLRENIAFLEQICADGDLPVVACRMLPYAGTPIEAALQREGRLRGDVTNPDYEFLDARINRYFEAINGLLSCFMQGPEAFANQIGWAWQEYWVVRRLFPPMPDLGAYRQALQAITADGNALFLDMMRQTAADGAEGREIRADLTAFKARCADLAASLVARRDDYMAANQAGLLAHLRASPAPRDVPATGKV
jgi:radical SAM superfamily enzyme YgiQ (UPF0313 family)